MALINEWVGYIDRSYQQAKESIISRLPTATPEMTDHSESNIFIKMVSIFSGILEQIGYYIDNRAREAYLSTCRKYSSAVKIASHYDYRIKSVQPASVNITLIIDAPSPSVFIVPAGLEVDNGEGVKFITQEPGTFNVGDSQISVGSKQVELVSSFSIGTTNGSESQRLIVGRDVSVNSVTLTVGGVIYNRKETLLFSLPSDLDYIVSVDEDKNTYIELGDGISGILPNSGLDVSASYLKSLGEGGNVAPSTLTNIGNPPALPTGVNSLEATNLSRAAGGEDVESLASLKRSIPKFNRTNDRGVTELDFADLAELVPGVAKAKAVYDCGVDVDVYVAPNGGGTASTALLSDVLTELRLKKLVGPNPVVFSAGVVEVLIEIVARIKTNESNVLQAQVIKDEVLSFMQVDNQEIQGTVYQSDIYERVENVPSVNNSNIISMVGVPFATIVAGTNSLVWSRTILASSPTRFNWLIRYVGSNEYQLYRNSQFLGIYSVGGTVVLEELSFEVQTSAYQIGDTWSFITYPASSDLLLDELSIPTAFSTSITVTCTGGV